VTLFDHADQPRFALPRATFATLVPWHTLDGGPDGPVAVALSDSGRLLFVAVRDDPAAPDGQPKDALIRVDTTTGDARVFARVDLGPSAAPRVALAHFSGRLHLAARGELRTFRALANDTAGTLLSTQALHAPALPTVPDDHALAVDRLSRTLYAARAGTIARAPLSATPLTFTTVGTVPILRAIAWSDHPGNPAFSTGGLFTFGSSIAFIPANQARSQAPLAPTAYFSPTSNALDGTADARGRLVFPTAAGLLRLTDDADPRLSPSLWIADEFAQVVAFAKGLVSPDGEPPGWVIDADVQQGWSRFHPATPDAACWTILLLVANDHVNGDAQTRPLVASILARYAGRAPDGIVPSRTPDGVYRHWINPLTGQAKPGWDPEFSIMSTMKIVLAADRAAAFYPHDAEIQASARAIICGVTNPDAYFRLSDGAMALKALPTGGPDLASISSGWHEGLMFAQQAAVFGGQSGQSAAARWLNRSAWPIAISVAGQPVTVASFSQFQPAFITAYALLTSPEFRAPSAPSTLGWREHTAALRQSHDAWTDDNGPRWSTVFSAGTAPPPTGYNADSLSSHPADISTFPSLMAFAAAMPSAIGWSPADVTGAYHAYRVGARQTFLSGASILYRRSNTTPAFQPNSAGLPDVAPGALGLLEALAPGSLDALLARPYLASICNPCPADLDRNGLVNPDDLADFIAIFFTVPPPAAADFDQSGAVNPDDLSDFITSYFAPCP
jgi:hypothetical protein